MTGNRQIYFMQLNTLTTGILKLKEFLNFIIVRRNYLLNNICRFVSPNFRFKETHFVNFFTDPELSSSLYILKSHIFFSDIRFIVVLFICKCVYYLQFIFLKPNIFNTCPHVDNVPSGPF